MIPPGTLNGRVRIANVTVLPTARSGTSGPGLPRLQAGEPFRLRLRLAVQSGPRLRGPGVVSLLDVDVRAYKSGGAAASLLASDRIGAVTDEAASTVELAAPGLEPGQYRLVTLVTFGAGAEVAGFHDGPVVTVS